VKRQTTRAIFEENFKGVNQGLTFTFSQTNDEDHQRNDPGHCVFLLRVDFVQTLADLQLLEYGIKRPIIFQKSYYYYITSLIIIYRIIFIIIIISSSIISIINHHDAPEQRRKVRLPHQEDGPSLQGLPRRQDPLHFLNP
jgi:hypothetical protein